MKTSIASAELRSIPMRMATLLLMTFASLNTGRAEGATPWFQDGAEWANVSDAIQTGPWSGTEGDVSLSTDYAHTGSKSIRVCYRGNEDQGYLALVVPGMVKGTNNGKTHIFLRWWELRGKNYDWSGEKFNRVMGLQSNSNLTIDYPLGWVAQGGWGLPGTNDAGSIQMFGNSSFSNGDTHWKYTFNMPREEWHLFEYELKLNDVGVANGESRLWVDDNLVAEVTNVELRFQNHTVDQIWMGGWYSGGNAPEPSPACRYIDDVSVSDEKHAPSGQVLDTSNGGGDAVPPVISAVSAANIGQADVTIAATTSEPADFQVDYGTTTSYGNTTPLDSNLVTAHSASLSGLSAGTTYHYRVRSRDAAGNLAVSGDNTFTTAGAGGIGSAECTNWTSAHPEWIWCDDFESGNVSVGQGQYFDYDNNGGNFIPVNGVGLSNSYGMRARWQTGQVDAGTLHLNFGRNPTGDRGIRSTENFRDIYYRVFVRTQAGWTGNPAKLSRATVFARSDWSQAMIAHLWGSDGGALTLATDPVGCVDSSGTVTCSGWNDFAHMRWLGQKRGSTALYATANADKWYCVESHVRLNDPGQSNGVQEFWIDGQFEAGSSNLDFVGTYTDFGINSVFLENHWNTGSPQLQERYLDNFVVSTRPIGCTPQAGLSPPSPPRIITVQ